MSLKYILNNCEKNPVTFVNVQFVEQNLLAFIVLHVMRANVKLLN